MKLALTLQDVDVDPGDRRRLKWRLELRCPGRAPVPVVVWTLRNGDVDDAQTLGATWAAGEVSPEHRAIIAARLREELVRAKLPAVLNAQSARRTA